MRFCRSCYATLADDEAVCHACGARLFEHKPVDETVHGEPIARQPRSVVVPKEKLDKVSTYVNIPKDVHEAKRKFTLAKTHRIEDMSYTTLITLSVLIVFVSYLLVQHALHTEVSGQVFGTGFLDEFFHGKIVSELRSHPADYYSIFDQVWRPYYRSSGPTLGVDRPFIFYIWLLAPTVGDIKWLYVVFAVAGSVASYFTIFAATRQRFVALLSAAWMAYFLEGSDHYLMYEYWAINVFLIGLALFFMNHHAAAAGTIVVAALIREDLAPFLLFASFYYLATLKTSQEWVDLVTGRHSIRTITKLRETRREKEALVWIIATFAVIAINYLNDGIATGGYRLVSTSSVHNPHGFKPEILMLLFNGDYFRNPLSFGTIGNYIVSVPVIVTIALALIGIAFLDRDQIAILLASFALLPILIPLGAVGVGGVAFASKDNVPSRWVEMSITIVNLFWLMGIYKICEYIHSSVKVILFEPRN